MNDNTRDDIPPVDLITLNEWCALIDDNTGPLGPFGTWRNVANEVKALPHGDGNVALEFNPKDPGSPNHETRNLVRYYYRRTHEDALRAARDIERYLRDQTLPQ